MPRSSLSHFVRMTSFGLLLMEFYYLVRSCLVTHQSVGVVEVVAAEILPCPFIRRGQVAVAARIVAEEEAAAAAAATEVAGEEVLEAGAAVARRMWKSSGKTPSPTALRSFRKLKLRGSIAKGMAAPLEQICMC